MKKYLILTVFIGILAPLAGHAGTSVSRLEIVSYCGNSPYGTYYECDEKNFPSSTSATCAISPVVGAPSECAGATVTDIRCNGFRHQVCLSCRTGYDISIKMVDVSSSTCSTQLPVISCCATCSNCTSDATWTAAGTGYVKKTMRSCNCGTCETWIAYECAAGYYGAATTNTPPTCTKCPSFNGVAGTSSQNTTTAAGCCLPADKTYSDTSGNYIFSGGCCAK